MELGQSLLVDRRPTLLSSGSAYQVWLRWCILSSPLIINTGCVLISVGRVTIFMEVSINKWPAAYHLEFSQLNRHSAVSLCLQLRPFSYRFATLISKFLGRFGIQASEGQGAG